MLEFLNIMAATIITGILAMTLFFIMAVFFGELGILIQFIVKFIVRDYPSGLEGSQFEKFYRGILEKRYRA